jgi:hypothetical protein
MMSQRERNKWGVRPPKSVAWSVANGVCDGFEFICRACCVDAMSDVTIYELESDKQAFWLSGMEDEGFSAVTVAQGVECAYCEKEVK